MRKRHQKGRLKPQPLVGSAAVGSDASENPVGAEAVGGEDHETPLRGALVFGNDPEGKPRGSEAFGGDDPSDPLKGALLFGNDPEGDPRGAEAFGGADKNQPLRGALRFGNDPQGEAAGSEVFGVATNALQFRGAQAFGARQLARERLARDVLGYDFGGVMLKPDEGSIAGVRKHPMDKQRQRVVRILERRLDMDIDRLRHGLGEHSIKWGRIKHDVEGFLDKELALDLRRNYSMAPGDVLGIAQVRALLEESSRMHTFSLTCAWTQRPITLSIHWADEIYAYGEMCLHKEHAFFRFKDWDGELLGYADTLRPQRADQVVRIRDIHGQSVGSFQLQSNVALTDADIAADGTPESEALKTTELSVDHHISAEVDDASRANNPKASSSTVPVHNSPRSQRVHRKLRFRAVVRDEHDKPILRMEEQVTSPALFKAVFKEFHSDVEVGRVVDKLADGRIVCALELEFQMPHVFAWALAAIVADLSRLRRAGWPEAPDYVHDEDQDIPSIDEALGAVKRSGTVS